MSSYDALLNALRDIRLIISGPHCPSKVRTVLRHLKLTGKEIAIRRGLITVPASESIGGHDVRFASYGMLLSLWREIYLKAPYWFESGTGSPSILDVGSNIGLAVLFWKHLYPMAKIKAFEPDARVFALLEANVESNRLREVELINKAVDDHEGILEWHFDKSRPDSLSMSTVSRGSLPDVAQVPCVRLSDYITGPVDFAKIDVEGAEDKVIAELCDSGKIDLIQEMAIEFHPWCGSPFKTMVSQLARVGFAVRSECAEKGEPFMVFCRREV